MTSADTGNSYRGRGHFTIGVSVFLLAFAVFGWGLHSKLSLYHLRARAARPTPIAKLLSERERPSTSAQHCDLKQTKLQVAALAATIVPALYPSPQSHPAAPRRQEQPPSSRLLALKGPLLRRPPPPSLFA